MIRFLRWLPLLMFVWLFLLGATAVAQTVELASSVEPTYGQKVTFRLVGQTAEDVEQIELFINHAQAATPFSVAVRFTQNEAGQLVASYDLDPVLAGLSPFAEVRFWWEVQTAALQTILIDEETFIYQDDRFDWQIFAIGDVTVHWTGNDATLGQLTQKIVSDSRDFLDDILPQTAVSPLSVYIYPATSDLRAALRLAGRDWQNEHTDPDLGVLLVTAVNPLTAAADLSRAIPHELTHLRLYQLAGARDLPLWYEEGIALLAEGDSNFEEELLVTAVANQTTLPFSMLCSQFPTEAPESDLALAQSVSLLRYIQAQFGSQALRQLGIVYLSGEGCEAGLEQTLDLPLAELNVDWLRSQEPQPAWLSFLSHNGLWLLLVVGSFGLFALMLRK